MTWPGCKNLNIPEAAAAQCWIQIGEQIACCMLLLIPWRGVFLTSPSVMTSSLKALLYRDPGIFFSRPIILPTYWKFPRWPWLFLNPCFAENITLPLPPDFRGENPSEFEKPSLVRTEFPGVVSLPWNSDVSGSSPNATRMKEGARIICQIGRSCKTPLKSHEMKKREKADTGSKISQKDLLSLQRRLDKNGKIPFYSLGASIISKTEKTIHWLCHILVSFCTLSA